MSPTVRSHTMNHPAAHWRVAAAVAVCAIALAGCGTPKDQNPTAAPTSGASATAAATGSACTTVSAPLQPIDAQNPDEPRLFIPQPAGWQRNTSLDSSLIRYVLTNPGLAADAFAPNAVVTLEHIPGTDTSPKDVLEQQRRGLLSQTSATDLEIKPSTTCGVTAEVVSYTLPAQGATAARPAKVLVTAAPFGGSTWSATVTVQAINADDPTYEQDASMILTGFQMLPPSGS